MPVGAALCFPASGVSRGPEQARSRALLAPLSSAPAAPCVYVYAHPSAEERTAAERRSHARRRPAPGVRASTNAVRPRPSAPIRRSRESGPDERERVALDREQAPAVGRRVDAVTRNVPVLSARTPVSHARRAAQSRGTPGTDCWCRRHCLDPAGAAPRSPPTETGRGSTARRRRPREETKRTTWRGLRIDDRVVPQRSHLGRSCSASSRAARRARCAGTCRATLSRSAATTSAPMNIAAADRDRRRAPVGQRGVGDPHPDEQQRDRRWRDMEQVVGSGATQEVREDQGSHRGQTGDRPERGTALTDERRAQCRPRRSARPRTPRRTLRGPGRVTSAPIGSAPRPPVV